MRTLSSYLNSCVYVRSFAAPFLVLLVAGCQAQPNEPTEEAPPTWEAQESGTAAGLRGLSVVSDAVAWASGSKGTYLRTTNGGETWESGTVPDASELDFRVH